MPLKSIENVRNISLSSLGLLFHPWWFFSFSCWREG